ncbi:MAG TPA: TonB-dependent receptor [Vicinamibacterales bacterium]|nr:TonB-dependent receptor [Vicinamibacterales bacterium]
MRFFRPGGRALPRRLRHLFLLSTLVYLSGPPAARAADVSGIVVDQSGRPLARTHVRILPEAGSPTPDARTIDLFTDESGRFTVAASAACRIEAARPGFRTVTTPCSTAGVRIELPVAPIEETVVVTATRTGTPASQTGAGTTTFTADDIERRQAPLVSELLRVSPGAMVMQTGAPGGVTGLFVRGGESNYNAVLVDGIPLNEPGGTFNFNNLTTGNIERIEIVRGANSALFGSDAMSSVVQLFTKRGTARRTATPAVDAQVEGGSYGTARASAAVSGATPRFDYSLSAGRFSTDNRVPNSRFDNTTVSANLGVPLGASATLRGIVRGELGTSGTPGQTAYGRPDLDAFYEHSDVVGGITFDQDLTPSIHQRATYSLSSSKQASTNLLEDPPYTPSYQGRVSPFEWYDFTFDSHTTLRRHFASYQADWHIATGPRGDHRLTALADWNGERADLDNRLTAAQTSASRDNLGVSLQHQLLWRRLATTAGARVERNENFGTAVVPRGSAVLTLRQSSGTVGDTRIRAAAGLGIKEPTVLQTFSTSPYFKGNPDLEPERSRAVEFGVEQRVAADRLKLDAAWFDNRYRNIIGLRSTGGYTSEYFNIGLTRARGAELGAEVAPHASTRIRAGYTFVDSAIVESTSEFSPVFAVGQWAFRRPRHSGYVQGSWAWQRVTADITGLMIGRFVDSDFSSLTPSILENAGRVTWDARASYRITSKVTGLLSIDNLANRDYQEPLGYLALQRAVRLGVRVGL